jgi:hypothetical protein
MLDGLIILLLGHVEKMSYTSTVITGILMTDDNA